MGVRIRIEAGEVTVEGELNDSETAGRIAAALPIRAVGQRWGEEIYFSIPVEVATAADAREVVTAGELGYWEPGKAFCIFFGRTPASRGKEIRAASAVNIVGKLVGDFSGLSAVPEGAEVSIVESGK